MNLALYLATFDKNQLRKFREAFGPRRDPFVVGTFSIPQEQFVRENPKLSMWLRGIYVIAFAQLEKEKAKLRVGQAEVAAIRNYLSSPPGA